MIFAITLIAISFMGFNTINFKKESQYVCWGKWSCSFRLAALQCLSHCHSLHGLQQDYSFCGASILVGTWVHKYWLGLELLCLGCKTMKAGLIPCRSYMTDCQLMFHVQEKFPFKILINAGIFINHTLKIYRFHINKRRATVELHWSNS